MALKVKVTLFDRLGLLRNHLVHALRKELCIDAKIAVQLKLDIFVRVDPRHKALTLGLFYVTN